MMERGPQINEQDFERKKRKYFSTLALKVHSAFELHKNEGGLWAKDESGKRSWGNVSEHCLVEVARAEAFSELLGLSQNTKQNLMYAAAIHDFSKRREKELPTEEGGITWDQYDKEVSDWSREKTREAGFNESIVKISTSMGHDSLAETGALLGKPMQELSEDDLAYLVMHYIDNYSRGTEWVTPTDDVTNEIDARVQKDANNKTLRRLMQDSFEKLGGRSYADVMSTTGHEIEQRLAALIKKHTGVEIKPLHIPEYIDEEIRKKIEAAV